MAEFVFEEPLDKDYECPICLDVQREAHLTKCCGNHFCFLCIARVVRDGKLCPTCNCGPLEIFPNKDRQRKISALRVGCRQKVAEGEAGGGDARCSWRGELRDFEQHQHHSDGDEARETDGDSDGAVVAAGRPSYRRSRSQEFQDEVALLKEILRGNSTATRSSPSVDGIVGRVSRLTISQSAGQVSGGSSHGSPRSRLRTPAGSSHGSPRSQLRTPAGSSHGSPRSQLRTPAVSGSETPHSPTWRASRHSQLPPSHSSPPTRCIERSA